MKMIHFFTQEGEWAWLDPMNGATPMFYKNWDSGEPSDSDAGEDCVEFLKGNGRWNDINCVDLSFKRPICQKFF